MTNNSLIQFFPISNNIKEIRSVQKTALDLIWKASTKPNEILLCVNLSRGVDFWEPEIQNNVIAFIPFSDPTDLLVQAKNKLLNPSWKDEITAINIEQAHGRIHRGILYLKDVIKYRPDLSWLPTNSQGMIIKRTFITDSNFNTGKGRLAVWYIRNKRFFSKSFNEVIIMKPILKLKEKNDKEDSFKALCSTAINEQKHYSFHDENNLLAHF